jgi:uncharacterized protein YjiS (DUF1127 family)
MVLTNRLMRAFGAWRQRRDTRRRGVHGLVGLSERILADIDLRRADVHAAMMGVAPLGRRTTDAAPQGSACRNSAPLRYQPCLVACSKA